MTDYRVQLHAARISAGLSQRELAKRIECADSTISLVELCRRHLGAPLLFAWATECGISLDELRKSGLDGVEGLEVSA